MHVEARHALLAHVGAGRFDAAREVVAALVRENPRNAEAWFYLGAVEGQRGDFVASERACRKALEFAPGNAEALCNLGVALTRQGRPAEAETVLRGLLAVQPLHVRAWLELAATLAAQGKAEALRAVGEEVRRRFAGDVPARLRIVHLMIGLGLYWGAERECRALVEQAPENPECVLQLGIALFFMNRHHEGIERLEDACARFPAHALLACQLGKLYEAEGDLPAAERWYRQALDCDPDRPEALAGLATVAMYRAEFDQAAQAIDRFHARFGEQPMLAQVVAGVWSKLGRRAETIAVLERLLARPGIPRHQESRIRFELARQFDAQGRHREAWDACARANRGAAERMDRPGYARAIAAVQRVFSVAGLRGGLARSNCDDPRPVFVVGMPRSGTTLVEQILAAHPAVHGVGESPLMPRLTRGIDGARAATPFPDWVARATPAELTALAEQYLDAVAADAGPARRIIDKLPGNFLYLGLIDRLFPKAHVIHCRRDPLDTCLSCHFHDFSGSHPWRGDLGDMAVYFRAYWDLMAHWRTALTLDFTEVVYERLVADPEAEVRRLIGFLGLDWDPVCLDFHRAGRAVSTASSLQVRQPLHAGAVGRWRNYTQPLAPLARDLEDILAAWHDETDGVCP